MKITMHYRKLPRTARLLLEIAIFVALWFGIQAWQTRTMPRGPLPAITASDVRDSGQVHLPIDSQGPYLVHFWATWCPICTLMEESVMDVAGDYPVIGVALQSGSDAQVLAFMREHGMDYPVISDQDGEISSRFGVTGVPSTFVVDRNGTIRFVEKGFSSEWGLRARLWYSN